MIGLFDSGIGGETILAAAKKRLPGQTFFYYADTAHMPYGDRPAEEVIDLTAKGVTHLFNQGCKLVVLACNTASAVAARRLQQKWLPAQNLPGHNVLGIVVPTVEFATHTGWAAKFGAIEPGNIGVFATTRTVESNVFPVEIEKLRPELKVFQQPCPDLASAIERGLPRAEIKEMVKRYANLLLMRGDVKRFILGCTHYAHIEDIFREVLPEGAPIIAQPEAVSEALADYLQRHPEYAQ